MLASHAEVGGRLPLRRLSRVRRRRRRIPRALALDATLKRSPLNFRIYLFTKCRTLSLIDMYVHIFHSLSYYMPKICTNSSHRFCRILSCQIGHDVFRILCISSKCYLPCNLLKFCNAYTRHSLITLPLHSLFSQFHRFMTFFRSYRTFNW